jgi:two-component system, NtrC family, response regulator AtoC
VEMPPLRERKEEIPFLAHHFMRKVAAKYERDPLPISSALMKVLASQKWPGNLRELENTIKRYLILGNEQAIIEDLNPLQKGQSSESAEDGSGVQTGLKHLVRNLKGDAEAAAIAQALDGTGWNRKVAASDLKISYKALLYKVKQYNLNPPKRQPASMGG